MICVFDTARRFSTRSGTQSNSLVTVGDQTIGHMDKRTCGSKNCFDLFQVVSARVVILKWLVCNYFYGAVGVAQT